MPNRSQKERSYFIRITPDQQEAGLDQLDTILETIGITKYFICEETATRLHFHACIYTDRSAESLRYQLKRYIEGEVYISGKDIQDQVKAVAYCMKDGKWRQKNMEVQTILMAKSITRPKAKPFDKQIGDLIDEVSLSDESFIKKVIDVHCQFNRKIYPQHIAALTRTRTAKIDEDYKQRLADRILMEL